MLRYFKLIGCRPSLVKRQKHFVREDCSDQLTFERYFVQRLAVKPRYYEVTAKGIYFNQRSVGCYYLCMLCFVATFTADYGFGRT